MLIEFISSYFGQGLICETSKSIYSNIASIISYHLPEVELILKDIDIKHNINIINSLIFELKEHHNKSETFKITLTSINDILTDINNEIKNIESEIINHKQKWFYRWRTPVYNESIKNLKNMKIILNNRLDYFVKIIQMFNALNVEDNYVPPINEGHLTTQL